MFDGMMTAHELASNPEAQNLMEHYGGFRVKGGRVIWNACNYSEVGSRRKVSISRLEPVEQFDVFGDTVSRLHFFERWISPDTEIELVK